MTMFSMESQLAGDIERAMRCPLEELCAALVSGEDLDSTKERFLQELSEAIGKAVTKGIEETHGALH